MIAEVTYYVLGQIAHFLLYIMYVSFCPWIYGTSRGPPRRFPLKGNSISGFYSVLTKTIRFQQATEKQIYFNTPKSLFSRVRGADRIA